MNKIIDTHLHCWDMDKLDYYWLENDHSILAKNYSLNQIMPQFEAANVGAAVLVQATNSLAETDWLLDLASKFDNILGAVVWLPLLDQQAVSHGIIKYSKNPFFKGVRHQIHDEADTQWLLQPQVLESLELLAQNNIPFDVVGTKLAHIETVLKVAEKIPSLKLVFDHLNQPPCADKTNQKAWQDAMKTAAKYPNIHAKISGLGTTTGKPFEWRAEDIKPAISFVLEHFGSHRVFCGGDWPVCLLAADYTYTWQQYQIILQSLLSLQEQQQVYYKNAEIFYNLKYSDKTV